MKYLLKNYSIWELGKRSNQEDSICPPYGSMKDSDTLFIVCDGMGGHSSGEVASAAVCNAVATFISENVGDDERFGSEHLEKSLTSAYNALNLLDDGADKKMGTTLALLKLHIGGALIAHIGDSRVYHIRPGKDVADTQILFQTVDHSLVNDLIRIGELTPEEARSFGMKNVITRALQPNLERRPKADIYCTDQIQPGDYFFLCSDGILENIDDNNIKYIFSDKVGDGCKKRELLIKSTSENKDNHSAILVQVVDVIF